MRDRAGWIAVVAVVTLGSCGGDDPVSGSAPPSLNGQVLDVDGAPVAGAHIGLTFRFSGLPSLTRSGDSPFNQTWGLSTALCSGTELAVMGPGWRLGCML